MLYPKPCREPELPRRGRPTPRGRAAYHAGAVYPRGGPVGLQAGGDRPERLGETGGVGSRYPDASGLRRFFKGKEWLRGCPRAGTQIIVQTRVLHRVTNHW